jgi:two-component system sensor histidine kinase BaeS
MTLQRRFFIALTVLLVALLLVFMGLTRLGLQHGLGQYVAEIELSRMDWLAKRLLDDYAGHGNSWEFLKTDANAWHSALMSAMPRRLDGRGGPGGPGRPGGPSGDSRFKDWPPFGDSPNFRDHRDGPTGLPPFDDHHRDDKRAPGPGPGGPAGPQVDVLPQRFMPPPPPNAVDDPRARADNVYNRLALLGADGQQHLAGNSIDAGLAVKQPLAVAGRTVGYLALLPLAGIQTEADRAFVSEQSGFIVVAGLVGLLLALLISWRLARRWLAPIEQLAGAAQAVAAGRLDANVPVHGKDELATLAQTFNHMTQRLAAMESSRQQWLSDVAHELRTPLAAMRAEIEALQDGVRPFDAQAAERLHRQVMRLGQLVDDLRLSMDPATGAPPMNLAPVEPLRLLLDALALMRERFAQARIAVDAGYLESVAQQQPVRVLGDERRLHQVFVNLLENALRYTHAGGRLQLYAGLDHGPHGRRLVLLLDDTAPCPAPEELARLFERLYRGEASRSRELGGSGLGLAICKAIVEAHGGSIGASASALGGLRIELALPLAPSDDMPG